MKKNKKTFEIKTLKSPKLVFSIISLLIIGLFFGILIGDILVQQIGYKIVFKTLSILSKLWLMGYIATFIGGIFEFRSWMKFIAFFTYPFIKLGKFSNVSGASFLTAFISSKAANSLIVSSYKDDKISRREMFLCGACNSCAIQFSHYIRIMFRFIGLSGMVGVYYYSFNLGTCLILILLFTILNNYLISKKNKSNLEESGSDIKQAEEKIQHKILSWKATFKRSNSRAFKLLLRMLIVSTPLYFLSQYLIVSGILKNLQNYMPKLIAEFITPEVMSVLVARLGGLTSAATVGGALLKDGTISQLEFLFALIIANIITNPIRTVRRNLPNALSIFPKYDGFYLVLMLQTIRFLFAVIAIVILGLIIYNTGGN